jgi:alginate O-acetyltransferase complex protein AlgI
MLFCSLPFLVFFVIVFLAYWLTPWHEVRVWLLLIASFYFYASWNKWLACVIFVSTITDYFVARGMERTRSLTWKRVLLFISVAGNLGLLVYFKYANFFLRSLEEALQTAGLDSQFPVLKVLLPIGISFYTFEAINYVVDVYRGKGKAERNLAHFILFILFFPHLIAGPIVRARDFLPQVRRPKRWDWARMHLGVQLFLLGMFKKLAIADRMAQFADPIFKQPTEHSTYALWLAGFAYALQVYCDFSGYTDMALGTAHMLGYKLTQNFNMPYISANIAEFWRRWHISLSTWLRDYLFIPLGGSRGSRWKTYRNLLLVMALGGLWHGASWPYVVFGVIQGIYLIIHRAFRFFCEDRPRLNALLQTPLGLVGRVLCTFVTFTCSLVVFRNETLANGFTMLGRMFVPTHGHGTELYARAFWISLLVVAIGHALTLNGLGKRWIFTLPSPVRGFGYAAFLTLALMLAPDTSKAFIYFQF